MHVSVQVLIPVRMFFSYGGSVSTSGTPLSAEFQSLQMFKVGKALALCTKQQGVRFGQCFNND